MKKQSFVKGSVILIASAIISKGIGVFFKIPLTNMLGGMGMSIFSCAYGLFLPVYVVITNGLTTAVAKLTAENCAVGNLKNIRKIRRISLLLFSAAGFTGMLIICIISEFFSDHIASCPDAWISIVIISPSVFLGSITAVYRGCCEGMSNMYPTALSQIAEAVVKVIAGLGLCLYVFNNPEKALSYFPSGTSVTAAASAAAILGITASTLAGTLLMYIFQTDVDKYSKNDYTDSSKKIIKKLMSTFIPVALAAVVTNLTSIIDLTTIIRCLERALSRNPSYFADNFSLNNTENIPEFLYGCFTGLAITIFNLMPSVTNMFGKGILPHLAESFAVKNRISIINLSEKVFKATCFFAFPSGIGIFFMSEGILNFLFSGRPSECAVSYQSLSILGIAVIFLCLSSSVFSCFQAAGKADIPVKIMLAGVAVKLLGNLFLIPVPQINISGAAISTLMCYMIIFVLSVIFYKKITNVNLLATAVPYIIPSVFCGGTALAIYKIFNTTIHISLPVSIISGGIIYLILLKLTNKLSA